MVALYSDMIIIPQPLAVITDIFRIGGDNKRFLISGALSSCACIYITSGPSGTALQKAFLFFVFVAGTTRFDSMSMTQARHTELMNKAGSASDVIMVRFQR